MTKYRITIAIDDASENPLPTTDYPGVVFACNHSRYTLGNMNMDELLDDYGYTGDPTDIHGIIDHMSQYGYVEPLAMTDHSGLAFHRGFHSGWDTGIVGITFIPNDALQERNFTMGQWGELIDMYLDDYEHWLNGEYYCFHVSKYTSEGLEWIDSAYGFLDYDACKDEALMQIPDDNADIVWQIKC